MMRSALAAGEDYRGAADSEGFVYCFRIWFALHSSVSVPICYLPYVSMAGY